MTLQEILKANGLTDEEIAGYASALSDPKISGALTKHFGALESQNAEYKTENERWANWHKDHGKPTLELYEKERNDARAEAASLRERMKIAEEGGFLPTSSHANPNPNPNPQPAAFDPKAHKLVTQDDIQRYADMEGDAMAMNANIAEEYRHLYGKSIIEHSYVHDGRTYRGMEALRQENKATGNKMRLDDFAAQKFDFGGKRQAIADKQKADAEAAIRADERAKVMQTMGDPNLRAPMPSVNPFLPRPQGEGGQAKQPWERGMTPTQMRTERLQRAMATQMKSGAVQ